MLLETLFPWCNKSALTFFIELEGEQITACLISVSSCFVVVRGRPDLLLSMNKPVSLERCIARWIAVLLHLNLLASSSISV